jgi:glucosamine--fructose-6-phosphate aminotransferase (isomerizing)
VAAVFHFNHDRTKDKAGRPARVQRALHTLEMELEQIMKGNYEHYMQKEIHEQPDSLTTTMRGRLVSGGGDKPKGVVLGGLKVRQNRGREIEGFRFLRMCDQGR